MRVNRFQAVGSSFLSFRLKKLRTNPDPELLKSKRCAIGSKAYEADRCKLSDWRFLSLSFSVCLCLCTCAVRAHRCMPMLLPPAHDCAAHYQRIRTRTAWGHHTRNGFSRCAEDYHGSNTVFLVGSLMSVVGGVFILFATMALCYRSVVVHNNFSLCLRLVSRNPPR